MSSAPAGDGKVQTFQITHRFHFLYGRSFSLVTYRHNWGEDRVYFHDDEGKLSSVPARWTSIFPVDPFVNVAAGRSPFRLADLMKLSGLLEAVSEKVPACRGREGQA
ncbi:MAG: DUF5372 family protein [Candidatus Eisenbacteria bacterium]